MKAIIVSRVLNEFLYKRMLETCKLPFELVQAKNFSGYIGSVDYLFYCATICENFDWVINIDEDVLILNNENILELLKFLEHGQYDFCGMPDGGVCNHRNFNPVAMNPFFNVFSKKFCKKILSANKQEVLNTKTNKFLENFKLESIQKNYKFVDYEPFYCIFFWALQNNCKPFFLNNIENLNDNISTLLKNNTNKEMLIHTWYSRDYKNQSDRIDKWYKIAKNIV
jgi:hypothetical protein